MVSIEPVVFLSSRGRGAQKLQFLVSKRTKLPKLASPLTPLLGLHQKPWSMQWGSFQQALTVALSCFVRLAKLVMLTLVAL